jgi:hypothetical protein
MTKTWAHDKLEMHSFHGAAIFEGGCGGARKRFCNNAHESASDSDGNHLVKFTGYASASTMRVHVKFHIILRVLVEISLMQAAAG